MPYAPVLHGEHTADPAVLYCPGVHTAAVAFVDPDGQAYPARHRPLQLGVTSPDTLPKEPPAHMPLQLGVDCPGLLPYQPTAQGPLQLLEFMAAVVPYCPSGHAVQLLAPASEN